MTTIKNKDRWEWHEDRRFAWGVERYLIIGTRHTDGEWDMLERSTWESVWYRPQPEHLERLTQHAEHLYRAAHRGCYPTSPKHVRLQHVARQVAPSQFSLGARKYRALADRPSATPPKRRRRISRRDAKSSVARPGADRGRASSLARLAAPYVQPGGFGRTASVGTTVEANAEDDIKDGAAVVGGKERKAGARRSKS